MNELSISTILRRIYSERNNRSSVLKNSISELESIVKNIFRLKYSAFGKEQDFVQEFFQALWTDMNSGSPKNDTKIWDKCLEENEDSSRIINSYFYSILRTAWNKINKNELYGESVALYKAVRDVCSALKEENMLSVAFPGYYSLPGCENPEPFYDDIILPFSSIRTKDGKISKSKLKIIIMDIFNIPELENCRISLSHLTRTISSNTGVGNDTVFHYEDTHQSDDEEHQTAELPDTGIQKEDAGINSDILIRKWWERLSRCMDCDELYTACFAFYYRYEHQLTLEEIAEKLQYKIKKSSVPNYISKMIRAMEINKDLEPEDPKLQYYIDLFIISVKEKYKFQDS